MKVVICGDVHIGAVFGLGGRTEESENSRVSDYEKTLNHIIDETIKCKAKMFIQTGDAFEHRSPSAWYMSIWNKALARLSSKNITSVIMMGNHDYIRNGDVITSSLSSLAAVDYPNVKIILKPQIISMITNDGNLELIALPFRDRKMYSGKTTREDSELYDAEVKSLIEDCDHSRPIIAIGHNFFYEGSYGSYGGTEILTKIETYNDCDLVAMGHYHDIRKFKKESPIAFYTGAMERSNFGDSGSARGFFIFDTNTKKVTAKRSPVRDLLEVTIDLSESDIASINKNMENSINDLEVSGKIVRCKIQVNSLIINSIKKARVQKLLELHGAHYVSRVIIEPISLNIIKTEKILSESSNIDMFTAYMKGQKISESELNIILEHANTLIGADK